MERQANPQRMESGRRGASRLQQVFEAMPDGVLFVDRKWNVTWCNGPGRRLLTVERHAFDMSFWNIFPATILADSSGSECYRAAMQEGRACEFEVFHPSPLDRWIHVSVRPVRHGIVLFLSDTTLQHEAIAELVRRETLRAMEDLAFGLSHEINTPLQCLTNLLYLARQCCKSPKLRSYLEPTEREIERIADATTRNLRLRDYLTPSGPAASH